MSGTEWSSVSAVGAVLCSVSVRGGPSRTHGDGAVGRRVLRLPYVSEAGLADSQSQCPQQEPAVGWPVWTDDTVWSLCPSQVCQRTRQRVSCGPDQRPGGGPRQLHAPSPVSGPGLFFPGRRAGPWGDGKRQVLLAHLSWTAARTLGRQDCGLPLTLDCRAERWALQAGTGGAEVAGTPVLPSGCPLG